MAATSSAIVVEKPSRRNTRSTPRLLTQEIRSVITVPSCTAGTCHTTTASVIASGTADTT